MNEHRKKGDNAALMDSRHVTNVTTIPNPGYSCVIIFESGKGKVYRNTISNEPACMCPDFF